MENHQSKSCRTLSDNDSVDKFTLIAGVLERFFGKKNTIVEVAQTEIQSPLPGSLTSQLRNDIGMTDGQYMAVRLGVRDLVSEKALVDLPIETNSIYRR